MNGPIVLEGRLTSEILQTSSKRGLAKSWLISATPANGYRETLNAPPDCVRRIAAAGSMLCEDPRCRLSRVTGLHNARRCVGSPQRVGARPIEDGSQASRD